MRGLEIGPDSRAFGGACCGVMVLRMWVSKCVGGGF